MRWLFVVFLLILPSVTTASVDLRIHVWPRYTTYRSVPIGQQVWVRRTIDAVQIERATTSDDSVTYVNRLGQRWKRSAEPVAVEPLEETPSDNSQIEPRQSTSGTFSSGTPNYRTLRTVRVVASAYNSRRAQTDTTPWRVATGRLVRDGDIACNFLPLGTLVRIVDGPELVRGKIFRVEDRLADPPPFGWNQIDIWMLRVSDALAFGKKNLTLEVLGDPAGEAPH